MKLGIVQMQIVMGDKTANLHRAVHGIDEAADEGAELVVLPECCDLGWLSDRAEAEAESYDGVFVSSIAEAATAKGVFAVVGFTERDTDDIYNSALLIAPGGDIVLHHRKINVLSMARHLYSIGNLLECVETDWGKLALTICADSWERDPTKTLSMMGAEVVISPSAWACDHGSERWNADAIKERYRSRTSESGVFLVGADSVGKVTEGPWTGKVLHGSSLVYGPEGDCLAEGKINEEELLLVDIDPSKAGEIERNRVAR